MAQGGGQVSGGDCVHSRVRSRVRARACALARAHGQLPAAVGGCSPTARSRPVWRRPLNRTPAGSGRSGSCAAYAAARAAVCRRSSHSAGAAGWARRESHAVHALQHAQRVPLWGCAVRLAAAADRCDWLGLHAAWRCSRHTLDPSCLLILSTLLHTRRNGRGAYDLPW